MPVQETSRFKIVSQYFYEHEKLILGVLAALVVYAGFCKVENIIAAHDRAGLTAAQVVLASQQSKDAITTQLAQQQADQFKAQAAAAAQQNAALEAEKMALLTALSQQQKRDDVMSLPDLSTRWGTLVPGAGLSIVNGQLTVSDAGAHATVSQLERVPVLEKQVTDTNTQKLNADALLVTATGQVATLNTLVAGKDLELKGKDAVCNALVKVEHDKATKSKRKWFEVGFVTGFVARQALSAIKF